MCGGRGVRQRVGLHRSASHIVQDEVATAGANRTGAKWLGQGVTGLEVCYWRTAPSYPAYQICVQCSVELAAPQCSYLTAVAQHLL